MTQWRWSAGGGLAAAGLCLVLAFGAVAALAQAPPSPPVPTATAPSASGAPLSVPGQTIPPSLDLSAAEPALAPPGPAATPIDPVVLEAFVDGLMGGYMRDEKINGAAIAVVRRDGVLLLKGYGADRVDGRPVEPERTLFRIASISKTFTWMMLLQLIEEGKVQLDAPINDYLPPDARVANFGFAEPVRVRHLMTHTAGFEDSFAGRLFRASMNGAPTLAQEASIKPPARVRPAGEAAIYSNYGSVLAGLIVQTVGDREFQAAAETRLFGPLGMQRTSFREPFTADPKQPAPLSEALAQDVSQGFTWRAGAPAERPFEFVSPNAPAGGASTTASDMARYMRMFLNKGALDGQTIVSPETIAKLEGDPLFANAPGMNGLAYGFMQTQSRNGWRSYGHGGNTLWFASWMAIYPQLDLGVFVIGNTEGASRKLQVDVPRAIVDQFFPPAPSYTPLPKPDPTAFPALSRLSGQYLADRRNFTGIEKVLCVVGCTIAVTAVPEGQLVISANADTARLTPLDVQTQGARSLHRFRNVETNEISAFIVESGQPVRYASANGVARASRIEWLQQPQTFQLILSIVTVISLIAGIAGLWRALRRRREGSESRVAGVLVPLAGWAWVGVATGLTMMLATYATDSWQVFAAWPPTLLPVTQALTLIACALSLASLIAVALAWRGADWSAWRRVRLIFTLAAFTAAPIALSQWNLLLPS